MAKPENPAETPVNARLHRPVQRGVPARESYAEPARDPADFQALPPAPQVGFAARERTSDAGDAFDTTRGLSDPSLVDGAAAAHDTPFHDTTRDLASPELLADADLHDDVDDAPQLEYADGPLADGPLADDGFIDDAELEAVMAGDAALADGEPPDEPEPGPPPGVEPRPGLAWARPEGSASRTPIVPIATLERPSSRLELTPSPVPRVALAPATGAVDISLVPGPHVMGGRNLPTLAAQHLVGRRPRRPARAVTAPPPSARSREPRSAFALARDVRSSKGEIVLGLTIGLGVSLLLAGVGQAYLRGDALAGAVAEESESAQLESVTLSARPEASAAEPRRSASPEAASPEAASPEVASPEAGEGAEPRRAQAAKQPASKGSTSGGSSGEAALFAAVSKRAEPGAASVSAKSTAPSSSSARATPPRATSPRRSARAASEVAEAQPRAAAAPAPTASPNVAPAERPPASAAPLTPAQSAGLGLDLPL